MALPPPLPPPGDQTETPTAHREKPSDRHRGTQIMKQRRQSDQLTDRNQNKRDGELCKRRQLLVCLGKHFLLPLRGHYTCTTSALISILLITLRNMSYLPFESIIDRKSVV